MTLRHDTRAFLQISGDLLDAGCRVRFRAHGASMIPAIRDGETVTVETVDPAAVKPGDILLYHHQRRPIAHRVVEVRRDGDLIAGFVLRGDAKAGCDALVKPEQILGRVVVSVRSLCATMLWRLGRTARRKISVAAQYCLRRKSGAYSSAEAARVLEVTSSSVAIRSTP
jgi:signal peptidase I